MAPPHNNGMHPTRDTHLVIYLQSCGRAGDAGRWAASTMMKTFLTLIVVAQLGACSPSGQSPAPVAVNSPPHPATYEGSPPMSDGQMQAELARISKEAGLPNLKDANLSDAQTELRLWRGFGLALPVCFVLKIDRGNPAASFTSPKIVGNKAVFHNGSPIYVTTPLDAPRSGWANLLAYLKQNGIDSSINLALDKRDKPDPDIEALFLEMKTGSRHTMTYYLDSTDSDDGKKAYDICEIIKNEFNIQIGCKR
jgi:hypothetical protein